jgi:hypothetical protein
MVDLDVFEHRSLVDQARVDIAREDALAERTMFVVGHGGDFKIRYDIRDATNGFVPSTPKGLTKSISVEIPLGAPSLGSFIDEGAGQDLTRKKAAIPSDSVPPGLETIRAGGSNPNLRARRTGSSLAASSRADVPRSRALTSARRAGAGPGSRASGEDPRQQLRRSATRGS